MQGRLPQGHTLDGQVTYGVWWLGLVWWVAWPLLSSLASEPLTKVRALLSSGAAVRGDSLRGGLYSQLPINCMRTELPSVPCIHLPRNCLGEQRPGWASFPLTVIAGPWEIPVAGHQGLVLGTCLRGPEIKGPGVGIQAGFCHLLCLCPEAGSLTSLCLSFPFRDGMMFQ